MSDGKIIQENGENIMPITHETCVLDDEGNPITETIGDVSLLSTESRNLVGAINEVFGDIVKEQIIDSLINNGIDVSINDSWSDIIEKMKQPVTGTGLDIISATELPATGKENQICIIMENPIENYLVMSYNSSIPTTDSVILIYGADEPNYTYQSNNQIIQYNFNRMTKDGVNFKSYYWYDSKWNILTYDYVSLLENGVTPVPGGNIQFNTNTSYFNFIEAGDEDYIRVPTGGNHMTSTAELINFNLYNKVEVDAKVLSGSAKALYIGLSTTARTAMATTSSVNTFCTKYTVSQAINSTTTTTYTYDISDFTGSGYLTLFTSSANVQLAIVNVRLYP